MRSSSATQNQFVTNKQHSCMYSPATISAMLLSPTVLFARRDKLLNQEAHLAREFLLHLLLGSRACPRACADVLWRMKKLLFTTISVTCIPHPLDLKPLYLTTDFFNYLDMSGTMKSDYFFLQIKHFSNCLDMSGTMKSDYFFLQIKHFVNYLDMSGTMKSD
jgi:hypothetical protein